jgi:hypothetical protein
MENGLLRAIYSIISNSLHLDDYNEDKTDILENAESQYYKNQHSYRKHFNIRFKCIIGILYEVSKINYWKSH